MKHLSLIFLIACTVISCGDNEQVSTNDADGSKQSASTTPSSDKQGHGNLLEGLLQKQYPGAKFWIAYQTSARAQVNDMSEPGKTAPVWSLSLHNKIDDFTEGIKARNGTPEHLPEIGDGGYFDTKKSSVFFLKNGRGVQFAYADLLAQPGTPCPDPETLKQIASQLAKSIKL